MHEVQRTLPLPRPPLPRNPFPLAAIIAEQEYNRMRSGIDLEVVSIDPPPPPPPRGGGGGGWGGGGGGGCRDQGAGI